MKLGRVTWETRKRQKKIDDDIASPNLDVIFIILMDSLIRVIQNLDFGHMVYNFYISINSNLYFTKNENRTKKFINLSISKTKGDLVLNDISF